MSVRDQKAEKNNLKYKYKEENVRYTSVTKPKFRINFFQFPEYTMSKTCLKLNKYNLPLLV